jgi:hypothetical protein
MAEFNMSNVLSEVEVSSERAEAEDTGFTDTAKSYLLGHRSGEFSASGQWDGAAGKTDVRFNTQMNGTKVPVTVVWTGTTPADATLVAAAGGNLAETQYDMGGGVGDIVPVEVSGRLDGGAAFGYCLALDSDLVAVGGGVDVAIGDQGTETWYFLANLHVISFTGTSGTYTVTAGTDGVTYGTTLTTFTAVTGATSECKTGSTTVDGLAYVRLEMTVDTAVTAASITAMFARML